MEDMTKCKGPGRRMNEGRNEVYHRVPLARTEVNRPNNYHMRADGIYTLVLARGNRRMIPIGIYAGDTIV